jgi:hypothetical protein
MVMSEPKPAAVPRKKAPPPTSPISWIGFFAILAMLTWAFFQG